MLAFNEKIDIIKKINDIYFAELLFLTECDMTLEQIKDYMAKCKVASEQISNYVTECKTAYEQMTNYIPKYELMDKRWNDYMTKYQSDARNANAEPPEEFKKIWAEHNAAFNQFSKPLNEYIEIAKKLNAFLESEAGNETIFHMAEYGTKAGQTSNKNTENKISLTDIQALFCKLNTNGKKEIFKRLEELTHLKQYTDK